MTIRTVAVPALAANALLLTACGGGSPLTADHSSTSAAEPSAGYVRWSSNWHNSIGAEGRKDYKDAMLFDCAEDCSEDGDEWFLPWLEAPTVDIPRTSSQEEVWAIRRAIAIVNRSLPDSAKLKGNWTNRSLVGFDPATDFEDTADWVADGAIHAEIYPYEGEDSAGIAWTDGERAFALGNQVYHDLDADEEGFGWQIRMAVETMTHEFMHALGFWTHPHPVHTSLLSYRHEREGELDNVPLIDAAVLYDMYGFGQWDEDMTLVVDTVDGVQFGVYGLHETHEEDERSLSALIPWVDAGYMAAPTSDALLGWASYQGDLVGTIAASGNSASGDTALRVNFDGGSGSARFDQIQEHDGTTWRMWNRRGYQYTLNLYAQYFDSSTDPRDQDGIPDVVGAFYGWDAEVAAGTLQRPEITAAFGVEKD